MRTRPAIRALLALGLAAGAALAACGNDDDEADDAASVAFATPADGDTVSSPVSFELDIVGLDIHPAEDLVDGAGHMHIMVNTDCVEAGDVIPADDSHLHFGDGSTSGELELDEGEHTLCLQHGDNEHRATDHTDTITVTVE